MTKLRSSFALACLLSAAAVPAAARDIVFADTAPAGTAVVIPLGSVADLSQRAPGLDEASRSAIVEALGQAQFTFEKGSTLALRGIPGLPLVIVAGTGRAPLDDNSAMSLGGKAANEGNLHKGPLALLASGLPARAAAHMATGADVRSYRFDRYKSGGASPTAPPAPLTIVGAAPGALEIYARDGRALAEAMDFTRDLVNEPANVLTPTEFVARTRSAFQNVAGITIEVLDEAAMKRLGMGSMLAVGQGSATPPRLLAVRYRGTDARPLILAGKGITFDSGGISLKPGEGMWRMKGDMAGAASAVGAVLALAKSRAPVSVVAVAALAENMPGGGATRPGDIVRAMNGMSIEIHNTDAEGRLVLADAVAWAERQYRPEAVISIATLTGAKVGALGDEYAGLFSRDDRLAAALDAAGLASGELVWRLPLHPNHAKDMKSEVADIRNVVEGGGPGASLGAHFISAFVAATPFAHVDVAGNTLAGGPSDLSPSGANGFGVRLLDRFVRDYRPRG